MEWDVAAGDCIFRNSGEGRPRRSALVYNQPELKNQGFVIGLADSELETGSGAGRVIWFTGLSGSGKSSLAFDTIYAEGQRRYVESLSAYARQFLGQMDKPDVDVIEGLSPAISIDQKSASLWPWSSPAISSA